MADRNDASVRGGAELEANALEANALEAKSRDPAERAIDEAIAACGGDPRAAIRALLVAHEFLEAELEILQHAASSGYARGRLPKKTTAKP